MRTAQTARYHFPMLWGGSTIDWRKLFRPASRSVSDGPPDEPYRVFTREHDVELPAAGIPDQLKGTNPDKRDWRDDGSGWRDAINLATLLADRQTPPADSAIQGAVAEDPGAFVVGLLIDQSGSMKGQPIAAVASAVRTLEATLTSLGVRTEVLGFSTAGWHGGYARQTWLLKGRPPRPGRLCALLHVVYKSADEAHWTAQSQDAMLHPDLLRENVDGEALDWAAMRLASLRAKYRLLIILSDGASVDDSTLLENGPSYLERNLRRTIARIEDGDEIILGALGIGYAVDRYYRHSRAASIDTILPDMTALLESLLALAKAPER